MQNHTDVRVPGQEQAQTCKVVTNESGSNNPRPGAADFSRLGSVAGEKPPLTNRGVEFSVDWLSVTIWADKAVVANLIGGWLGVGGGDCGWHKLKHGGRGFKSLEIGPAGVRLYSEPDGGDYCAVEVPGAACRGIKLSQLQADFLSMGKMEIRFNATRLDWAFDQDIVTPARVWEALEGRAMRSLAKREKCKQWLELEGGGHTVYIGSRASERMARCYTNKDKSRGGDARLELENKGRRADAAFRLMLAEPVEGWAQFALSHVMDFVEFKREWWGEFCQDAKRAYFKLANWAEVSVEKSAAWVVKQVSPLLAVLEEIKGSRWLWELLEGGRARWSGRHRVLLAMGAGAGARA